MIILMGFWTLRMREMMTLSQLNRRTFLVSGLSAFAAFRTALALAEDAAQSQLERSKSFNEVFAALTNGAKPADGMIVLDLPEIAENGNFVPVTITIDSPMTEADHVTAIHLLSTANPVAKVATFKLSAVNGVARVQSRMRLAKTQDVVVLAQFSTGAIAMAMQTVKVTIGGCQS